MTPSERLAEAFQASSYAYKSHLARDAGVKEGTLRAYFNDHMDPPLDVCEKLAPLLGYSAHWLFDGSGPKKVASEPSKADEKRIYKIPLIDEVTAGTLAAPSSQIPERDWKLVAASGLPPSDYFALKVTGTSMDRISPEGSIIIVDRNDKRLVSGKAYVCMLRDETTYKLWYDDDPPQLHAFSTDPIHRAKTITKKRDFTVIGRVKRTVLDL